MADRLCACCDDQGCACCSTWCLVTKKWVYPRCEHPTCRQPAPAPAAPTPPARRTKRRFAHELYPHAGETEIRPLAVEVPYLWARFVGLSIDGTGWQEVEPPTAAGDRVQGWRDAARTAALADAIGRGLTGDHAWTYAENLTIDVEVAWERAVEVLGADVVRSIKPYRCGPEPEYHYHPGTRTPEGWEPTIRVATRESACDECTEPVPDQPGGHAMTTIPLSADVEAARAVHERASEIFAQRMGFEWTPDHEGSREFDQALEDATLAAGAAPVEDGEQR